MYIKTCILKNRLRNTVSFSYKKIVERGRLYVPLGLKYMAHSTEKLLLSYSDKFIIISCGNKYSTIYDKERRGMVSLYLRPL
jgi:hypothetical protein